MCTHVGTSGIYPNLQSIDISAFHSIVSPIYIVYFHTPRYISILHIPEHATSFDKKIEQTWSDESGLNIYPDLQFILTGR